MTHMFLIFVCMCCLINTCESHSCTMIEVKKFTETPEEVQHTCHRNNEDTINKRWRGELSIKKHKSYIEIEWKKIVQRASCAQAMEFFVDGVKEEDIWSSDMETVRIDKIEKFSLKVKVFFKIARTTGHCYGPGGVCKCFEATNQLS